MKFRLESDSIGEKKIPAKAYYGVQSLRSKENFSITNSVLHEEMIKSLCIIKKACALTNNEAGILEDYITRAIVYGCDEIIAGNYHDQFITDPIQGGAGTSANMNANEVIANIANVYLGSEVGTYKYVDPLDHVNRSQSTNDVFPTAGKIASINLSKALLRQLEALIESLDKKAKEFDDVLKLGRTQLQDAVPIRLGQEFQAYSQVLKRDKKRILKALEEISIVNMGGTAIGTGLNVDPYYFKQIVPNINKLTGLDLRQAENLVDRTSNLDSLVVLSSSLKTLSVNLSKMASDLRLMSSGPRTMVQDIQLPSKQSGSSIMPGKVNPVIPEVVNQICYRVIGNDMTITLCAENGQLELNAFEPVLFYTLFESIEILTHGLESLNVNCIQGIMANREKLSEDVEKSIGIITSLVPHIGYRESTKIAQKALERNCSVKQIIIEEGLLTKEELEIILDPYHMTEPGIAAEDLIKERLREKKA